MAGTRQQVSSHLLRQASQRPLSVEGGAAGSRDHDSGGVA